MGKRIRIMLAGICGYGENYIKELLSLRDPAVELSGIVDPFADRSPYIAEVKSRNIPVFSSVDEYYLNRTADLTVISSPIHTHYQYIMSCLNHGSNVLCEKPICGDADQVKILVEREKETGLFVAIGYQLCFARDVLALKRDILGGVYGKPLLLKSMWLPRRNTRYYRRNKWAGMTRYGGEKIYDSPLNNACAHQLQIMLFLLGGEINRSAEIIDVDARLWKARPDIDNYDAAAVRLRTVENTELLFFAAHCVEEQNIGPMGEFVFEKGVIRFERKGEANFTARFNDGGEKSYAEIEKGKPFQKLYDALESALSGKPPVCTLETAEAHTRCVAMVQNFPINKPAPEKLVYSNTDPENEYYYISGLSDVFVKNYNNNELPPCSVFGPVDSGRNLC
ncbi:MAG: Gfo/Idh/MocA family oxidoreductase [Treponema sp.]|jgi:predicted dehydrogenase|nr:Gfo/Idh/MocA family oxidoreductase [Treponema sp.]